MKKLTVLITILLLICSCRNYRDLAGVYNKLDVSPQKLKTDMESFIASAPNRNFLNTDALDKAAHHIADKLKDYGYLPSEQKYDIDGRQYKNIIASYGQQDLPTFVIGAHYDVCGNQQGADDNASGVIGMLELARLCHELKPQLPFRIEFVAYTLEEPPFFATQKMGSFVHAHSLKKSNADILGMVCLEMIGYFDDRENSQSYPLGLMKWFYPDCGNFIAVVGNYGSSSLLSHFEHYIAQSHIQVESLKAPSFVTGVDFSDHRNYWHFDYPAVMVTDTSFFRSHHYHQVTDTVSTLDFDRMAEVIKGVYLGLIGWEL